MNLLEQWRRQLRQSMGEFVWLAGALEDMDFIYGIAVAAGYLSQFLLHSASRQTKSSSTQFHPLSAEAPFELLITMVG